MIPPLPWHLEEAGEWLMIVAADGVEIQAIDVAEWPDGRDALELTVEAVNEKGVS